MEDTLLLEVFLVGGILTELCLYIPESIGKGRAMSVSDGNLEEVISSLESEDSTIAGSIWNEN